MPYQPDYSQPFNYGILDQQSPWDTGNGAPTRSAIPDQLLNTLLGGGLNFATGGLSGGLNLLGGILGNQQQQRQAQLQAANQMALGQLQANTQRDVAGINVAPALQNAGINQSRYDRSNTLLNALLAGAPTNGSMRHGNFNPFQNQLAGLFQEDTGPSATSLAQQSMAGQPNLLAGLQQGGGQFFQGMPQNLFQQQLNQILGNASSALGGQLRGANAGLAGAGMAPGSAVGQGLQRQYGNQAAAGAQNAMTGAFLNKYGQDFQRQQAQGNYNTQLANLGLGQQQQNQAFGLGMGNLGVAQQQQQLAQRGQRLGLLSQLLA